VERSDTSGRRGAVADARCPRCGALNPPDAQWCGQCLTRFEVEDTAEHTDPGGMTAAGPVEADPLTAPLEALEPRPVVTPETAGTDPAPETGLPPEVVGVERGAFKVTGAGVVWRCATCGSENRIDDKVCSACNAPFAATVAPSEGPKAQGDPGTAALLSLFFAGAGHGYLGLWPQAIARGVVHLWVVLTVVAGFTQTESGGGVVAAIFVIVAMGLSLVSAHDAYREARHEAGAVILKGRNFLYLVMGLLLLLMMILVVTGLQARG
jgi:hypothetical protein